MRKLPFLRNKPHLNVGTIGPYDAGKTALTAALSIALKRQSGSDYNSFARGNFWMRADKIETRRAAYLEYETERRHYSHVDSPGRVESAGTAIAAMAQMDAAILVISAQQSTTMRSREQLLHARRVGVRSVVVFVNKCDLVDDAELLDLVEVECREQLVECGYDGDAATVLRGSALGALRGEERWALGELIEALDRALPDVSPEHGSEFFLRVWQRYVISGRGVVATGIVERGTVKVGDEVAYHSQTRGWSRAVVTGVESYLRLLDVAETGDAVGLLLRGLDRDSVTRGDVVIAPQQIVTHRRFGATIYVQSAREGGRHTPFASGYRAQLHASTADVTATITLPNGAALAQPGSEHEVTLELLYEAILPEGTQVILRESGKTVALGTITARYEG